jgi:hypothetical protein
LPSIEWRNKLTIVEGLLLGVEIKVKILHAVPSKKAMHIRGRSYNIFMNVGYVFPSDFIVYEANFQSKRGGHTSNKRLTSFVPRSITSCRAS